MSKTALILAALAAFAMAISPSRAAQVSFDASPDSAARRVVNVVFAEYLQERVGVSVETAVLDLDNDKTGEILVRFVHSGSCAEDMKRCRTAVLRYWQGAWSIVLDRPAATVAFDGSKYDVPGPLTIDGTTWNWGARRYEPDGSKLGDDVKFQDVPQANMESYAAAFGAGAQKIAKPAYGIKLAYSGTKIADGADTLIVKMDGRSACGDVSGCPIRVLKKNGDKWATVLSTSSKGKVAVSKTVRGGYHDLVVQTALGYAVMGWNGKAYAVADRIEAIKSE